MRRYGPTRIRVNGHIKTAGNLLGVIDGEPDDSEHQHASRRVAEQLRRQIEAGAYSPGEQLPSYRQLAEEFGIAVNTAQAAVRLLVAEGRATVRPSSGTFVATSTDTAADARPAAPETVELRELQRQLRQALDTLARVDRRLNTMIGSADQESED